MAFAKLIGFESEVWISNTVTKEYYNLDDDHWIRIRDAAIAFDVSGIGPKVIAVVNGPTKRSIEYERIDMIEQGEILPQVKKDAINATIKLMHSLGYAHGDLYTGNIGFRFGTNEVCIIDHDTVFTISEGITNWLATWMKKGFDWNGTLEEFVKKDYEWEDDI